MTITALPVRNEYTATAAQDVFNYTFKIFESTDLNVYVTPAGQAQDDANDLTTAYTVSGVGDEDGGSITLNTPASAGDLVTIVSSIPDSRTTDYQTNGDFRPPIVNDDFDRVVSLVKQVDDRAGRTLSFQESTQNATELTMPDPEALSFVRWKSDKSGMENVDLTGLGIPTDSSVITYRAITAEEALDTTYAFDTVADMVAATWLVVGMRVRTLGYTTIGDGGNNSYQVVAAATGTDDGGTYIDLNTLQAKGLFPGGKRSIKQYGAAIDGVTNDTTAVVATLALKGNIIIPKGSGACLITPPISVLSDTRIIFEEGAKFKAASTGAHVLGVTSAGENVVFDNPEVDGASIRGLNGFGFGSNTTNLKNITVNNPVARNCLRSATTGGGRGIAAQNGVESLSVHSPKVYDCTTGYDVNGNTTTIDPVTGILITNAYGENCEELISCFSDGVGTNATVPPTEPNTVQATITNIFGRNVGRSTDTTLYSGGGVAGDKDGGILVTRRGRNMRIGKMTVFNDDTYTIGSIFRGTGGNIQIDDFEFWGNCDALAIIGSADNLLPLTNADDPSYGLRIKGRHHGTATNLVDVRIATGTNFITSCQFDFEVDEFNSANSILTSVSTFRTDSMIRVSDTLNQREIWGTLLDVFNNKNTLASATKVFSVPSAVEFSGDVLIGANSRIDFTTTQGAAGAIEGYILVKIAGVTKKVAYYAVA